MKNKDKKQIALFMRKLAYANSLLLTYKITEKEKNSIVLSLDTCKNLKECRKVYDLFTVRLGYANEK